MFGQNQGNKRKRGAGAYQSSEGSKKRKKIIAVVALIAVICASFVVLLKTVIIPKQRLNEAIKLIESGDYDSAYVILEEIGNLDVIASNKYDRAVEMIDSGDYETAYALLEEIGENEAIVASKYDRAVILLDSGDYETAYALLEEIGENEKIASSKYDRAVAMINSENYEEAYNLLKGLKYKDSEEQLANIRLQRNKNLIAEAQIGSYITFGSYEQDNNIANGKEDIEWLVLAKENNRILVISRYALVRKPYNTTGTIVTWETCSLRSWLNSTFINNAFGTTERSMIPTVTVSADNNPKYNTNPGNSTSDQVFLLSINEVNKYFNSDSARQCKGTVYAYSKGAYKAKDGNCWWWLRSPGLNLTYAAYVSDDGSVLASGSYVSIKGPAVRPAMWIELEP